MVWYFGVSALRLFVLRGRNSVEIAGLRACLVLVLFLVFAVCPVLVGKILGLPFYFDVSCWFYGFRRLVWAFLGLFGCYVVRFGSRWVFGWVVFVLDLVR